MNDVYQMIGTIWTTEKHRSLAGICRDPWSHQGMVFITKKRFEGSKRWKTIGFTGTLFWNKTKFSSSDSSAVFLQLLQVNTFDMVLQSIPSHWTTFFRRFIIKISCECLGRHTSTMHDICSPKTGAWSVWYQMVHPIVHPIQLLLFSPIQAHIKTIMFLFFSYFCRKMDEDKAQETSRFHGSETMADHPTDHKWLISLVIVSLWFVVYLTNGVEKASYIPVTIYGWWPSKYTF